MSRIKSWLKDLWDQGYDDPKGCMPLMKDKRRTCFAEYLERGHDS